jgi:hypothetical protein
MSAWTRVGVVNRERAGPGGWPVPGSVRRHRERGRGRHVTASPDAFLRLMVSFPLMRVIGVAWLRGAWQRATRTAPGVAAVPTEIVLS